MSTEKYAPPRDLGSSAGDCEIRIYHGRKLKKQRESGSRLRLTPEDVFAQRPDLTIEDRALEERSERTKQRSKKS